MASTICHFSSTKNIFSGICFLNPHSFSYFVRITFIYYCLSTYRFFAYRTLLTFFLLTASQAFAVNHYEVVINKSVGESNISANSLRSVFSMHLKTWPDGTKIRVFVLADDDPLHQIFSKEKLNVFPYQLRSTWDRLVFSGTGQAPIKVNSIEEMLEKIISTPGAIGYLWRANINENVNVLTIK